MNYTEFLRHLTKCACAELGITEADAMSCCRQSAPKYARWFIWEIMWAKYKLTTPKVGCLFGKHHHTTVMHAFDTLPIILEQDHELFIKYDAVLNAVGVDWDVIAEKREKRAQHGLMPRRPKRIKDVVDEEERYCEVCCKPVNLKSAKALYQRRYCTTACAGNIMVPWIGYIMANAADKTQGEIRAHIGVTHCTYRAWVVKINKMGVTIPVKSWKKPKLPKLKKRRGRPAGRAPNPAPKPSPVILSTRKVNDEQYHWVRIDAKTIVQRKTA